MREMRKEGGQLAKTTNRDEYEKLSREQLMELLKMYGRFALSLERVTSLEEICRIYLLTPVFGNLGGQAEVRDDKCLLSVTDCHPRVVCPPDEHPDDLWCEWEAWIETDRSV